ncbi:MAG: hypothetical protein ACJAV4_001037, partial [Pontimonas sp.]
MVKSFWVGLGLLTFIGASLTPAIMPVSPAYAAAVPDQVTDLAGSASATALEVNLTWTAPEPNGDPISSYDVLYRIPDSGDRDSYTSLAVDSGDTEIAMTIADLESGVAYEFEVRAINGYSGAYSSSVEVTTAAVPGQVMDLTGSATYNLFNELDAYLRWTAPAPNGSEITSYTLEYRHYMASDLEFVLLDTIPG